MAALIVFGAISFSRMGVSQLPDVDFPVLTITVTLDGAAPEVMESTVVDPIEDAMMTIEGVRMITSSSKTGSASITLEFELTRNIDVALQEVQSKVAQVQKRLPKDVDPPSISKTNPDDQPIIWLALTYKGDPAFLMKYARDYIKDRFTTLPGVGEIFLGGYTDPVLRVKVKPSQLPRHNVAVNDIQDALKTEHAESPGGFIETGRKNFNVRTMGEAKSVDEFKKIIISKRAGQNVTDPSLAVRLDQVADVSEGLDEIRRISRFNGETALGLGIKKQRGSNAVEVAKSVKLQMAEISKQLPEGMQLRVNFDSTVFIEDSVHELNKHLMLAVILTALVCWMFLGSWSATFNVLLSIPTSIMGAFIGLYFFGFTLNTFTLLGLTLAIGIVVDDAIMVLENIFRYNEKGYGRIEAAIIGSREIAFAAMAATAAVIAIFLPVVFMKGIIGKFFLQFGVTISLAVFLSLIESLTITPMRCASFVDHGTRTSRIGQAFEKMMRFLEQRYAEQLKWSLANQWKVLFGALLVTVSSFGLLSFVKKEFTPVQDQSMFLARLVLPVGSSLAFTDGQAKKAESLLLAMPEVKQVYSAVGGFGGGASDSNVVMMFVTLKPKSDRGVDPKTNHILSQQEVMNVAREKLATVEGIRPVLQDLSQRGLSSGKGFAVEFTLMGPDWDKLADYSLKLMKEMEASGLMTDVDSNYLLGMPELQVIPDRTSAALHGVSMSGIGTTVSALIGGVRVGDYARDGKRYDIKLSIEDSADKRKDLDQLLIGNSRSNLIPMSSVTKIEEKKSLQSITRMNRQRAITITANLKGKTSQPVAMAMIEKAAKGILPAGYLIEQAGSSKTAAESFFSLIFALVMGLMVAYMVLASQFNSFLDPVAILLALPFSFTGAFLALLLTGSSINIYSMIGLLLLMGIVKKNSILLIEFTNHVRESGVHEAKAALIQACPVRLRPILMTSIATVAGAIPSATAFGEGGETMRPMAIALIGGVILSTILTLYVVPCAYSLMDRFRKADENRELTKKAFEVVGAE